MDEMMSETAFDARLNVLWECFFALQNHTGADVQEALHDLMTHPKEELDDASYMKLMYMKGLCYEEQGNKNAARYCAMRMYAIQECMRNPRKKRPRFLDLQTYLLQKRRMPDIFQKNQLNAIEKYVEQEVLEFDRPIRFS